MIPSLKLSLENRPSQKETSVLTIHVQFSGAMSVSGRGNFEILLLFGVRLSSIFLPSQTPKWSLEYRSASLAQDTPGTLGTEAGLGWNIAMDSTPIASMYGIFTYICHKTHLNVGNYIIIVTIHGSYGNYSTFITDL